MQRMGDEVGGQRWVGSTNRREVGHEEERGSQWKGQMQSRGQGPRGRSREEEGRKRGMWNTRQWTEYGRKRAGGEGGLIGKDQVERIRTGMERKEPEREWTEQNGGKQSRRGGN